MPSVVAQLRREAAGGDGAPTVDRDPEQGLALPAHGLPVLVPVGMLARDGAEVVDEGLERIGLSWRCVDDDALLDEAKAMAATAAAGPSKLARRIKSTLKAVPAVDEHPAAVDLELEAQVWSLGQPEFRERLKAMQQRISGGGKG